MGWWTSSRKAYALNYLIASGLSPYGAAGLVSRWANVESIASGPTAVNPYSGAFGIAQWLGSRLPPIRGNTNFDAQLAYTVQELNRPESYNTGRANAILRSAVNANEGAVGASLFERAEGFNSATGRDNFTARTAAGIPAILSLVSSASVNVNPVIPFPGTTNANGDLESFVDVNSLGTIGGVSALTLIAVGAGVLAIYLLTE